MWMQQISAVPSTLATGGCFWAGAGWGSVSVQKERAFPRPSAAKGFKKRKSVSSFLSSS